MMFYASTDSWVYILFGILWIAFAIYKGTNKAAKAERTGKNTSTSSSSGFGNIMESFLAEDDTAEDLPESREEDIKEKPIVEPEKPVVFEGGTPSIIISEKPAETSCRPKVRKINMKKAVIYSAILHRPYE